MALNLENGVQVSLVDYFMSSVSQIILRTPLWELFYSIIGSNNSLIHSSQMDYQEVSVRIIWLSGRLK